MHVLVTGAGGFVGLGLVRRLLANSEALPTPLSKLTLIDQRFGPDTAAWSVDARVQLLDGDFGDPALLDRACAQPVDLVFHLASVPGSLAEREPALGLQVNLLAPIALLHHIATAAFSRSAVAGAPAAGRAAPRVVFASSVAVYGALPAAGRVDESCAVQPALSYGAHKRMTEILLADLSRRGDLDGVSLRLPGIVARPPSPSGHGSAFMSELIRRLGAGESYECPVSPGAQAWWMSLPCCVDNLLHATRLPSERLPQDRVVQLPVITATVGELVVAIEAQRGAAADVRFRADERTEALFGRMPVLETPRARGLGFGDDGSLDALVRRATLGDGVGAAA